jgi:antitoxin component YwqK of YwqJK toxin-antitoxin module
MKFIITAFFIIIVTPQKRIINHQNFDYEFYISQEKVKNPKPDRTYYWYRSGEIHQSVSAIGGDVLIDDYQKFYKTKQLAEKGSFKNGLKDGNWQNWLESGMLQKVENWKKGIRHGKFTQYNSKGEKVEEGKYQKGKKQGTWIDYSKKDTLNYSAGKIIPKKVKDTVKREPFLKRIFKRKKKKSSKKENPKKIKKDAKTT